MKKNIHPDYHEIKVKLTNGTLIEMKSTYAKKDSTLVLDIDHLTHPAWTGVQKLMDNSGSLAKFNKKFAFLKPKNSNKE